MIKLHGIAFSNYYNKVKIALLEKGVPFEEVRVMPYRDDVSAVSPMNKVPFIEWDGQVLAESQVINEWLDEVHPEPPLMPKDPHERARVRELLAILEIHLELVARRLYREAFFGGTVSEETKKEVQRDLAKGASALRARARFAPYIAGPQFTLADCAALGHLPLVSLASKKIYGQDALEGIDVKGYVRACGDRPAVRKVDEDRKAAQAAATKT